MKNLQQKIKAGLFLNTIFLFLCGAVLGYISVQLIVLLSSDTFIKIKQEMSIVSGTDCISFKNIFVTCIKKCKEIFIYYIACTTVYGRIYNAYVVIKYSFAFTFFCVAMYIADKEKAIISIAYNYFPKLLILFPLYIMILKQGFNIYTAFERGGLTQGIFTELKQKALKSEIFKTAVIIILTVVIAMLADSLVKYYISVKY